MMQSLHFSSQRLRFINEFFLSAFKLRAKQISKEFLHGTAGTLNSLMKSSETLMKSLSSTFRSVSYDHIQRANDNETDLGGNFLSSFRCCNTCNLSQNI